MPGPLAHSPADIIATLLPALGVGSAPSESSEVQWSVYASRMPTGPGDCIGVFDTSGRNNGREMVAGEVQQHEGFMVRVRSESHDTGWAKADEVRAALDGVYQRSVSVGGTHYVVHSVTRTSQVIALGTEKESQRCVFTITAVASIRSSN